VLRGALMARGHFVSQTLAPLVYNGAIIAGGLALGAQIGAEGFAWGALVGAALGPFGSACLEASRVPGVRVRARVSASDAEFRRYLVAALPLMLGVTLLTVDEWYDRWFGALLSAGSVASLAYARQLMQLPVAVVGQAIATAALPTLSRYASEGRTDELDATLLGALRAAVTLACLGAAGAFVFAEPLVRVVYEGGRFEAADTARVATLLRIFAFAVPAWVTQQIAVRGFYARGDTWRPMWLGSAVALAALAPYFWLGQRLGAPGLALAGAAGMSVSALATLALLRRLHGGPSLGALGVTALRAAAVAALAGAVAAAVPPAGSGALGALLQLALGGAVFGAAAVAGLYWFGDPSQRAALRALMRPLRRKG
jgi:putative peptidoglycan lipid II flippase